MIDLHADTIFRLWEDGDKENLISNSYMIDQERLLKGGVSGQCFALFTPMYGVRIERDRDKSPWQIVNELHDRFLSEIERAGIPLLEDPSRLQEGRLSAILTTEEGAILEGDISRLSILKSWGVSIFGFTWNFENELGFPNSRDVSVMNKGLKEKGIEALSECERLGVLVDVSHLSDGGFWDIANRAKKPFLATHSNCRAITDVTRNLTDDMLRALSDKGGVAGLNYAGAFLRRESTPSGTSLVSDMVEHIFHMIRVGGEDLPAIGSDLDGIGGCLEIGSPDKHYLLRDALRNRGLTERVIEKIFYKNAKRILSG